MRASLTTFGFLIMVISAQAASASSGFATLWKLADGAIQTGRVQNGGANGYCQTRLQKISGGAILAEIAYAGGTKKISVIVPKNVQIEDRGSSLNYEGQDGAQVSIGHLNGTYFQFNVTQANGGPSVTCGSFVSLFGR